MSFDPEAYLRAAYPLGGGSTDVSAVQLGKICYEAFSAQNIWVATFQWGQLSPEEQSAWEIAARAVSGRVIADLHTAGEVGG